MKAQTRAVVGGGAAAKRKVINIEKIWQVRKGCVA